MVHLKVYKIHHRSASNDPKILAGTDVIMFSVVHFAFFAISYFREERVLLISFAQNISKVEKVTAS